MIFLFTLVCPVCLPAQEADPAEALQSIDAMLPERLQAVTATWFGDLDGMVERRVIRTLVVTGGPQFFYHNGRPRGMIAELLGILQKELNVGLDRGLDQVEIIPMPVSRDRLIPALVNGQADLIAADLTTTGARSAILDFSIPLVRNVREIVVFAPGHGKQINSIDEMAGHTVYVRRSSSYFEHLISLNEDLVVRGLRPVRIKEANELLRAQDILDMVNAGIVTATVIDDYKAR
jgi:ABC-type amino acid transport substrate-binding protein